MVNIARKALLCLSDAIGVSNKDHLSLSANSLVAATSSGDTVTAGGMMFGIEG